MTTETAGAASETGVRVAEDPLEGFWVTVAGSAVEVSVLAWVLIELFALKGAAPLQPKVNTHEVKAAQTTGSERRIFSISISKSKTGKNDCGHTCARAVPKQNALSQSGPQAFGRS